MVFLALRALSEDTLDAGSGAAVMKQRSGKQPRGSVQQLMVRAMSTAFSGTARSATIGMDQIQPAPVPVLTRQTPQSDVAHPCGGLSVQRIDEAPASRFRF